MKFRTFYLGLAATLLLLEVVIARYVHDAVIRPFGGDVLATMLVYCLLRGLLIKSAGRAAVGALLISYLLEVGQYFHLATQLGLGRYRLAQLLLGSQFDWGDMLAYTLGGLLVMGFEYMRPRIRASRPGGASS